MNEPRKQPVYKVLLFLKRRPGMSVSVEAFRDYYENVHSKIGEKYSQGLLRDVRRLLPGTENGDDAVTLDEDEDGGVGHHLDGVIVAVTASSAR